MVNSKSKVFFLIILTINLSACSYGFLYTKTVAPYCLNMQNTKIGEIEGKSSLKQISIPRFPGGRAKWSTNTINDIAKQAGINRVMYCDLEVYRILAGFWQKESIIVYGSKE